MTLEKELLDFDSNQEKRLSHLRTQLRQQHDDMIGKINLLWKTVFEKLNDVSTPKNVGNSMAPKSIAAISHDEREELRKKGINSQSKFFSPKYLSLASIKELNKNPSAPKRVHFVNSIVILNKDSDTEEDISTTNARRRDLGNMTRGNEEVKEQGKEEDEMETNVEVKEVIEEEESEFETDEEVKEILEEDEDDENFNSFSTMKELSHHEWLLKNPLPRGQDEGDRRGVRHLMRLEKEMMDDKGEVIIPDQEPQGSDTNCGESFSPSRISFTDNIECTAK
ncbi:hypothetical protein Tco_1109147 [Tanacetum coccineum]